MAETDPDTTGPAADMGKAEALATESGALTRGRFTLIGTAGTDELRRALVMTRQGDIVQVRVGDTLGGARIDAIAADRVLMTRNGRQEVLDMPQG